MHDRAARTKKETRKEWNSPYYIGLSRIFTSVFLVTGVESKHIVPCLLLDGLAYVVIESVPHRRLAGALGRTILLAPPWEGFVTKGMLRIFSDKGGSIGGMGLRRCAAVTTVDPISPYRWPWSATGGELRVLELCAVAPLWMGRGV